MPPEVPQAGSAKDWLRHAKSDLVLAGMRKTKRLMYEHLCFHAQQAAEKAIKAVLVHNGVRIPRSHDLTYLLGLLPDGLTIPPALLEVPVLTRYAVQQRYPGEEPPLTPKHRRLALQLAESTVMWAARVIRLPSVCGQD